MTQLSDTAVLGPPTADLAAQTDRQEISETLGRRTWPKRVKHAIQRRLSQLASSVVFRHPAFSLVDRCRLSGHALRLGYRGVLLLIE